MSCQAAGFGDSSLSSFVDPNLTREILTWIGASSFASAAGNRSALDGTPALSQPIELRWGHHGSDGSRGGPSAARSIWASAPPESGGERVVMDAPTPPPSAGQSARNATGESVTDGLGALGDAPGPWFGGA
jgi:hypothetical protein